MGSVSHSSRKSFRVQVRRSPFSGPRRRSSPLQHSLGWQTGCRSGLWRADADVLAAFHTLPSRAQARTADGRTDGSFEGRDTGAGTAERRYGRAETDGLKCRWDSFLPPSSRCPCPRRKDADGRRHGVMRTRTARKKHHGGLTVSVEFPSLFCPSVANLMMRRGSTSNS